MPKRKLEEVIKEIPSLESIEPIQYIPLLPIQHALQLHLPDINMDSPLAIFHLFFSDELFVPSFLYLTRRF